MISRVASLWETLQAAIDRIRAAVDTNNRVVKSVVKVLSIEHVVYSNSGKYSPKSLSIGRVVIIIEYFPLFEYYICCSLVKVNCRTLELR